MRNPDGVPPAAWPVPRIDSARCAGCGLCVLACPTAALRLQGARAVVARPQACDYSGCCERICPAQAVTRPFQIIWKPGFGGPRP